MFSIIWSKKKGSYLGSSSSSSSSSSSCKGSDDEGLRLILTKLANGNSNHVVIKPKLPSPMQMDHHHHLSYCYLKSCHLCHKSLYLDREIYMYMGDMGFCSVECRDRQIYLDGKKEVEVSAHKILSSFRQRNRGDSGVGGCCETRHPFSSQNNRVIFL